METQLKEENNTQQDKQKETIDKESRTQLDDKEIVLKKSRNQEENWDNDIRDGGLNSNIVDAGQGNKHGGEQKFVTNTKHHRQNHWHAVVNI